MASTRLLGAPMTSETSVMNAVNWIFAESTEDTEEKFPTPPPKAYREVWDAAKREVVQIPLPVPPPQPEQQLSPLESWNIYKTSLAARPPAKVQDWEASPSRLGTAGSSSAPASFNRRRSRLSTTASALDAVLSPSAASCTSPTVAVDSALATLRQWQSQDLAASPREQQQPAHKSHPTRPILTIAPAPVPGASQRGHRGEGRWGRGEGGPWGGPASAASQNHAAAGSIHPTSSCQWCLPESEGPSFPVLPAWAPSAKQLGLRRFSSTGPNQLYAHSQSSTAAVAAAAADSAIALPRVRAAAAHGAGAAAAQHGPPCGEHVWGSFRGGAAGAMGGGVSYSGGGAAAPRPSRLSDSCVPPLGGFNHGHCGGPGGPCAGGPLPGQHVKAQRLTADSVYPQQTPRMAAATFSKGSYQGGSFPAASPINQSGGRYPAAPMQLPPMDGAGSCPAASQQDAISALLKSPAANHAPNGGSHLDNSKARSSGSSSFKQAAGSPRSHIPKQGDAGHLQAHNPRQVVGGGSEDHQEDWLKLCMKEVKKINKKRVSQEQAAV